MTAPSTFWDDLAADLRDPEFLLAYLATSAEIESAQALAPVSAEGDE